MNDEIKLIIVAGIEAVITKKQTKKLIYMELKKIEELEGGKRRNAKIRRM